MDHSYSTSDMCAILGVGRETLRHYENKGLLKPTINKDNGYRIYGYWDVAAMVDVLKLRSYELSINDIKEMATGSTYDDITAFIGKQRQKYQEQIKHYQMLDKKLEIDMRYTQAVHGILGKMIDVIDNDLYFLPYHKLLEDMEYDVLQYMFSNSQFFTTAWHITENGNSQDPRYFLGFVTEKEFADYLKIGHGYDLPSGDGVGMVVDLIGHVIVNQDTVKDFNEKALSAHPDLGKDTYAILLSRFTDSENELHQYVFMYKKYKN